MQKPQLEVEYLLEPRSNRGFSSGSCRRASGPWPNPSSPSSSESASQQPWIEGLTRPAAHEIPDSPHGRWRTLTFLAALRCDRIAAPCVIDGPINGPAFFAWVVQFLVPTLRVGDIVVLDNLGSHKAQRVRRAIRDAGAHWLFLPPYSPDLNPIEQVFAKLKTLLRKAAERTVETTWRRIGALLQCFTPAECANYIRNAGYASV